MSPTLIVLGIETSCDETAAAVVARDADGHGTILGEVVLSQMDEHSAFGGVVPEIAARAHVEALDSLILEALSRAKMSLSDVDAIAATSGPGLIGGLIVGLMTGKAIARASGKPLFAINHLEGHALTARLTDNLAFPYLMLLVSGGHTQLVLIRGVDDYERWGTTIDDALGEAFDKTAKLLGLGYPGGPAVERAARSGNPDRFVLPRPLVGEARLDFSFSGLKTAAARLVELLSDEIDRRDLAASVQAAIARQLAEQTAKAMDVYPYTPRRFVVAGGVAANGAVREALMKKAAERGFSFHAPPLKYCTDNAAMIALAGAERLAKGMTSDIDTAARPRWPLDEAAAAARPMNAFGRKGAKA